MHFASPVSLHVRKIVEVSQTGFGAPVGFHTRHATLHKILSLQLETHLRNTWPYFKTCFAEGCGVAREALLQRYRLVSVGLCQQGHGVLRPKEECLQQAFKWHLGCKRVSSINIKSLITTLITIKLYYVILYYIMLYYIVLYCIVLYCIVLYCIVLYCIVLYYIYTVSIYVYLFLLRPSY